MHEPIAVIGSACRFPGQSQTPTKLWELLLHPRDVLKEFDPERLNLHRFFHENGDTHGATDVINKSYLLDEEDIRLFDASFFGISPVEAASIDPQQRILLETVYEAFESAGLTLHQMKGSPTGVYVGCMTDDWSAIQRRDMETLTTYAATGTASSIISNRISYVFDLHGPSETIDTACSSSLVAMHHAVTALRVGDCETAVVAGVNLILDPSRYILESKLHMLSPDARCRMWDGAANGYARGEGAAVLVLKPLRCAIRDGDAIDALIRGTGVNSGGQSAAGLTVPSAVAQRDLIRGTYRRAGLDPVRDAPQFVECHGTGTPVGDPVEARAISEAFINFSSSSSSTPDRSDTIHVGSIKTVIGHLEGCAGLAGVLKAILAIKHKTIPPNLLFNELNPEIEQYYGPLQITKEPLSWPERPAGSPMRASVNSFGFGGTNAHAIIESFAEESNINIAKEHVPEEELIPAVPLFFSARSGSSLLRTIKAYIQHLRHDNPCIDLRDLSWILYSRRSTHRIRASFSGVSRDAILEKMERYVSRREAGYEPPLMNQSPRILGIFTGQGAQWPAMGRKLFLHCTLFRQSIEACEAVLQALPAEDIPSWSLVDELTSTSTSTSSRINLAAISQPLCTAVQISLAKLLTAAGIEFDHVVGHSSGEIAAAYASGNITLEGAMQIAYYRGFHASLARGRDGEKGGMLAVGLSYDDALEFCTRPEFGEGHIQVAAVNAPRSVTISGNLGAILQAKERLEQDGVFVRQLKVDTAYHSHHMLPCAQAYLSSLLACNIQVQQQQQQQLHSAGKSPIWHSSVHGNIETELSTLSGPYWVENMVQPVLFSRAIMSALQHGGLFDLAVEIGPHPALKGPTEQIFKEVLGAAPYYTGTLKRGENDIEALGDTLAGVWMQLGPLSIDLNGFYKAFSVENTLQGYSPTKAPALIKDLPTYSWDHDRVFWRESRMSRRFRTDSDKPHELLGRRAPDDNNRELRWRNVLRRNELSWLSGHEVLGDILLPGAAYVSIAAEAGRYLAAMQKKKKHLELLEIENVRILRPVVVPDDKAGVETLFTVRVLEESASASEGDVQIIKAQFSYYVYPDEISGAMIHTCSGNLALHLRRISDNDTASYHNILPPKGPPPADLTPINTDDIYTMLHRIGLKYSGLFRSIDTCQRCLDYSTATGLWPGGALGVDDDAYLVHPALLDVAFQALLLARTHPNSGQVSSALLPSYIDRVRVVGSKAKPKPAAPALGDNIRAEFETWVVRQTADAVTGDLNIYDPAVDGDGGRGFLQLEGLQVRMIGELDVLHDRPIFSKTVWGADIVCRLEVTESVYGDDKVQQQQQQQILRLSEAAERMALFYGKRLVKELEESDIDREKMTWYHQRMLEAFDVHLELTRKGQHRTMKREWLEDTQATMDRLDAENPNEVELEMLKATGENLARVVRGEMHMLEVLKQDDLLDRYYMRDGGFIKINQCLARAMQQISFKFPRCNILEIGAGTGATTWSVLDAIKPAYDMYTYTDISAGFFSGAREKFTDCLNQMIFKVLDIERDPSTQGFIPHSYDVIIAANVLHATRSLESTLRNIRSLLRPGGYLLLFEVTNTQSFRLLVSFGGLSGLWLGEEENRRLYPAVSCADWDKLLGQTGFSGADTVFHDVADEDKHTLSLIVSQSVDGTFLRLQDPLTTDASEFDHPLEGPPVLLIGGKKLETSNLASQIEKYLPEPLHQSLHVIPSLDGLDSVQLQPNMDIICLHEIDEPLFTGMTARRLNLLQNMLINARVLLWVKPADKTQTPRAAMFPGIARVLENEIPQLRTQIASLETGVRDSVAARHLVESLLRLHELSEQDRIMQSDGVIYKQLWKQEPEVTLAATGQVLIPRVVMDNDLNEVYLASTHAVTKLVDPTDTIVKAVPGASRMMLQAEHTDKAVISCTSARTSISVKYAVHIPDNQGHGLYLVHWSQDGSRSSVIGISKCNSSLVQLGLSDIFPVDNDTEAVSIIKAITACLLSRALSMIAGSGLRVLVYEPPSESIASLITTGLMHAGARVYFVTSSPNGLADWIKIPPLSSKREAGRLLPTDINLYVDCMPDGSTASQTVQACLPPTCTRWHFDSHLLKHVLKGDQVNISALLGDAYSAAKKGVVRVDESDIVPAAQLAGADLRLLSNRPYVTGWQRHDSELLKATIAPLSTQNLFHPDRTYFMVGAAGGLGLSICRWMLRNGAKFIVIASRRPQINSSLFEDAHRQGARVEVVAMDVAKKESVEDVVHNIQKTMPPVAGVCNAAMVLSDSLFLDMDVNQLNKTLAPKVDGSEHLDAVFRDSKLDFFILLSSAAAIVGNAGQSNYNCANLYMEALVEHRRARGDAASIIHIGYVSDVGYVTRNSSSQMQRQFNKLRSMPLSEIDVHHTFAQAIQTGRPGAASSSGSHNIIMGIQPPTVPLVPNQPVVWLGNPRFGHFVPYNNLGNKEHQQKAGKSGDIRKLALEAQNEEDAMAVTVAAFATKLESILQLPPGSVVENPKQPLVELGIDSLVAVEIRTWFVRELGAEVPVVKILGGDSVLQLCQIAVRSVREGGNMNS